MKKMEMDIKDMLEYRKLLEIRVEKARNEGKQEALYMLLNFCDTVDIVIDSAAFATIMEVAPKIPALAGRDFNLELLAIAVPNKNIKAIGPSTQVVINFEEKSKNIDIPVYSGDDLSQKLKQLLSRNFVDNIHKAVDIYIKSVDPNLMPSDAWTQIKDMLSDSKLFPIWDKHISTQYRINGPVKAYEAIKKHLPRWDDIEIGRVCEDALKRSYASASTNSTEKIQLGMLLELPMDKSQAQLFKADRNHLEIVKKYFPGNIEVELSKFDSEEGQKRFLQKEVGRIIASMNPSIRSKMEHTVGRKPYVEKGY